MHIRVRIHHWVLWWFYVGVICGLVAIVNVMERDLSRSQVRLVLLVGVLFWLLGGLMCYACEGIRIEEPHPHPQPKEEPTVSEEKEWHAASDFLLPGNRKSLLPPRLR